MNKVKLFLIIGVVLSVVLFTGCDSLENSPNMTWTFEGNEIDSPFVTGGGGGNTGGLPSAPTGVTAVRNPVGSTTVTVSWNPVSGATSYRVYYSSTGTGSGSQEGGIITSTSFNSTGNNTNLTHWFRVSAVNSSGEGSPSPWVSVLPVTHSSTPRNITVELRDSWGDGWNGASILIRVNGVNFSPNATFTAGSSAIRTFNANVGDSVQVIWNKGSYDSECAFAIYYTNNPPSPAFNPNSGTSNNTARIIHLRQYGSLTGISTGTILHTFTVQ
jgi:hypothetical protein